MTINAEFSLIDWVTPIPLASHFEHIMKSANAFKRKSCLGRFSTWPVGESSKEIWRWIKPKQHHDSGCLNSILNFDENLTWKVIMNNHIHTPVTRREFLLKPLLGNTAAVHLHHCWIRRSTFCFWRQWPHFVSKKRNGKSICNMKEAALSLDLFDIKPQLRSKRNGQKSYFKYFRGSGNLDCGSPEFPRCKEIA